MRTTYNPVKFTGFPAARMNTIVQRPTKVVWHRQGNPGTEGVNGMQWGATSGSFSIHYYIDDQTALEGIPWDRHAFHVLESRNASKFGLPSTGLYGPRGDYNTIGVEMEDESPTSTALAPGQAYGLSQETRITAVLLGADIIRRHPWLTVNDFIEHADLDPWTRAEDIGDGLYMPDFRLDVADVLAGRTPWRTVGQFARGTATTGVPPVATFTQAQLDAAVAAAEARGYDRGKADGRFEMWGAWIREDEAHLNWAKSLDGPWNIKPGQ